MPRLQREGGPRAASRGQICPELTAAPDGAPYCPSFTGGKGC